LTMRDLPSATGAALATSPDGLMTSEVAHLWCFDIDRLGAASATCIRRRSEGTATRIYCFAAGGPR